MYNADMYNNRDAYKLAVYTGNGVYVTSLTAGNISVDNTKVQNTFKVNISPYYLKFANLYIKNNGSNYYQQIPYNILNNGSEQVFYLSNENYALYNSCNNAYMVLVTTSNVVYKLQLINNSKRVESLNNAIKLDQSNLYSPITSAANTKLDTITSKALSMSTSKAISTSSNKHNLNSNWAYAYSNGATMNIQKLGTALVDENVISGNVSRLSADTYDVYYTLKSDNCVFDIYKEVSIADNNVTNEISNSFSGEVTAINNEVNEGENVNLSISKLLDKNGNQLTEINSLQDEFIVTVTFADVSDSNNVYTREIKTKSLQDVLTNVKAPEKFGKYKITLNITINTYADIMIGDVNNDGKLGVADVVKTIRFMIGISKFTDSQMKSSDIDMSNTITLKDLVLLQRKIVGIN